MPEPPKAYRDADHHAVSAVIKWVEQGVAPDKIIAARFDAAGKPTLLAPSLRVPGGGRVQRFRRRQRRRQLLVPHADAA